MKYGIITHYNVHNHGAFLQLNALVKVLWQKYNITARALQFEKNYDFADNGVKEKHKISVRSILYFLSYIKERGIDLFVFNLRKRIIFTKFTKRERLIGEKCDHSNNLDAVIIGSDEVFALHTGLTPEFFGYNLPSNKVFSYAGSFGPTTIEDIKRHNCVNFIQEGLNSMVGMSMRDQNSIFISKELTGKIPSLVVDPVILYGYEKEISKLQPPKLPKYLLVYAYESRMNNPEEYKHILKYAHENSLIVICPGFFHRWADKNINTDPIELLRYFKYAEKTVTDTFHGCVLSLITGCEIAVRLRDNTNKLFHLMQEYQIENRIIDDNWDLGNIFTRKIDWDVINEQITKRRSISFDFLNKMIEK